MSHLSATQRTMESLDLLIIGAGMSLNSLNSPTPQLNFTIILILMTGWSGLAALKTYRETNPHASVALLDSAPSVGGVWATHRLWAGLKSNNMRGTYEYSDFPMDDSFGVPHGAHVPGDVVQRYLQAYVERFGLGGCIRLECRVDVIEHLDSSGWAVTYKKDGIEKVVKSAKLIMATGLTSQPYLPHIPGQEGFQGPLFHTIDMPAHLESIQEPGKRIAVLGGTKSAWDAVYAAATAGASVDWIIRDNGHGPCWMAPPYVTPLKKWLEKLVTTRLLTFFSPCIWADSSAESWGASIRGFLHGTWAGRKITDAFWKVLGDDVVALNQYDSHPELQKLKPWISPFWVASGLSILNYQSNFFDLVTEGKVRVHIDHIDHLSNHAIHLSSETLEDVSALVIATGWSPTPNITFKPASLPSQLGFPTAPDPLPSSIVQAADAEILHRFPRLTEHPSHASPSAYVPIAKDAQTESQALHPYRLTRFMVPVTPLAEEKNIAFMGVAMTINTPLLAQTQALWIAAYFSNRLSLESLPRETCPPELSPLNTSTSKTPLTSETETKPDPDQTPSQIESGSKADPHANILYETALHTQFGIHRYPGGMGRRNPDFVFDAIPYVDMLLRDLGIKGDRKEKGFRGLFEPYGVEDYVGVVGEWLSPHPHPNPNH